ncbi:MAG TPA: TonB family protein [Gammaproteobacteria bacterium]|nr:TonB family protein [Gammaproteobacteria bacterium]
MSLSSMAWVSALAAVVAAGAFAQPAGLSLIVYQEPKVWRLASDGSAVVAFTVRASGSIDDAITLAATERRLGDAAVEAIKQWRFERDPALGTGRNAVPSAVLRREIVEFVFRRDGGVTSMSHLEGAKSWFPKDRTLDVRMLLPNELDTPLVRVQTTESPEAAALRTALTVGGGATLSFVVDETGRVRVPAVVAAADPALGAAALAMLAGWRYEPPLHGGKPALVEQRDTFTFEPRER